MRELWRPIGELDKKARYGDAAGFLICAPELVDEDCNVHGIGMGFFQDDGKIWNMHRDEIVRLPEGTDTSCWLACKWSMTNDEWCLVPCNPTHYMHLDGPK